MISTLSQFDLFALMEGSEFAYPLLIFFLFVIPRFFVTLGIPHALTAFALGLACSLTSNAFSSDTTIKLMASLGITSLFLYAGMEVDFRDIRRYGRVLSQHVGVRMVAIAGLVAVLVATLPIDVRASIILALAVLTPSTGFIIESLDASSHPAVREFWIRTKAIAAEVLALVILFIVVRSGSVIELAGAMAIMVAMFIILPMAFKLFASKIAPFAPKSEFGFLLMIAFMAAMVTKMLGAYYLVGAFVVGLVARRFEDLADKPASKHDIMEAIKMFASFFTPIYFFQAGIKVSASDLSLHALGFGLLLAVFLVPIRVAAVMAHRMRVLREPKKESFTIATCLLPNLVFGLVLAETLREQYQVPSYIFGGLIIYTIIVTILPAILERLEKKPTPTPPVLSGTVVTVDQ